MSHNKIAENVKAVSAFSSERIGAATIFYNGFPITTGAVMIDTRDYDSADMILNIGTAQGAVATLFNSIVHSASNNPTAAIPVTSGTFTTRSTSDGGAVIAEASLLTKDLLRYIALKTEVQDSNAAATVDFSALCVLGTADSLAVSKTLEIDV